MYLTYLINYAFLKQITICELHLHTMVGNTKQRVSLILREKRGKYMD